MKTLVMVTGRGDILMEAPVFGIDAKGPAITLTKLLTPVAAGHIFGPDDRPHAEEGPFFAWVIESSAGARTLAQAATRLEEVLLGAEAAVATLMLLLVMPR